jgi:hypothetical protein
MDKNNYALHFYSPEIGTVYYKYYHNEGAGIA